MRLKFVQSWVDRKSGQVRHYFRRSHKRIQLPGVLGSAEFMAAYQAALDQPASQIGIGRNKPGSVAAAVTAYFLSTVFDELAPSTK